MICNFSLPLSCIITYGLVYSAFIQTPENDHIQSCIEWDIYMIVQSEPTLKHLQMLLAREMRVGPDNADRFPNVPGKMPR